MPREIVHWLVLEKSIAGLQDKTAPSVNGCFEQYKPAAYLGALAHDAPFYYRFGGDPFEEIAETLHGKNGEDTFVPMRKIAELIQHGYPKQERGILWSFLFGMLSHMCADIVFHPMIFYLTGEYYDPDPLQRRQVQMRHRLFEVYLDSWMRVRVEFWNRFSVNRVINELGPATDAIAGLLARALSGEAIEGSGSDKPPDVVSQTMTAREIDRTRWQRSFWYISRLQGCFLSSPLGVLARLAAAVSGGRLEHLEALFSYRRFAPSNVFDQAIYFQQPVTGEENKAEMMDLCDLAASECVKLLLLFEPLVSGVSDDTKGALVDVRGKSLNLGQYAAGVEDARYFSRKGIDIPGLSF